MMISALEIGFGLSATLMALVFALSGGHILFLPLLFVSFGLFAFRHRRRRSGWFR